MNQGKGSLKMWVGFAAGVSGVALLLPGWTVRGGADRPGAHITLAPQRSSDLDVQPVAAPLARKLLVPSVRAAGVGGVLSARNATADWLQVTLRASTETRALDPLLRLRVRSHGRTVFSGPLGSLRRGAPLGTLPSGATLPVHVQAWLAPDAGAGYAGRREQIALSFVTRSVRRPS